MACAASYPGTKSARGTCPRRTGQRFEAFEEPLPRAERFDDAGGAEPVAGDDVTTLDRRRRLAMSAVQPRADMRGLGQYLLDGLDGGLVMIGTHLRRLPAGTRQRLPEEGFGGLRIALLPEQDIHHLPVFVYRPLERVLVLAPEEEPLVDVALGAQRRAVLAHRGGEQRPEGLHPA